MKGPKENWALTVKGINKEILNGNVKRHWKGKIEWNLNGMLTVKSAGDDKEV